MQGLLVGHESLKTNQIDFLTAFIPALEWGVIVSDFSRGKVVKMNLPPDRSRAASAPIRTGTKLQSTQSEDRNPETMRSQSIEDEIRRRAYEIWLAGGGGNGHELDDWLEAEREFQSGRPI